DEARIAHVDARRLRRAVRADKAAQLAADSLDRVVDLAWRHPEALGDELEVVDQRLHARRELVSRRQCDFAIRSDVRAIAKAVKRLLDDLHRLVELGVPDPVAVVVVADRPDRDLELEMVVARVRVRLAQVPWIAGSTQQRPGDAQLQERLLVDDAGPAKALED